MDDRATESKSPRLRGLFTETKTLERNGHPHHDPVRGEPALGIQEGTEPVVDVLALRDPSVALDAKRIGREHVGTSVVVERVQKHGDAVVLVDILPPRQVSAHVARILLTDEDNV